MLCRPLSTESYQVSSVTDLVSTSDSAALCAEWVVALKRHADLGQRDNGGRDSGDLQVGHSSHASLDGAQTLGCPSDSSLGGLQGQTTYSSGEAFGLVAAEAVFGTNAVANAAACLYAGDGLGASYSIADCRMIGLDELDTFSPPAVSELNPAGGTSFSAYAMVRVGATSNATAAGSTAPAELLDLPSPAVWPVCGV